MRLLYTPDAVKSAARSAAITAAGKTEFALRRRRFSRGRVISVSGWLSLGLLLAAFLIRLPNFGNPAYELDEEFYLLVGDRMLHGMLPYVDIWDRKPIGLFLLYSAIRLLGGDGVLQYQVVATLFAGGTACLIYRMARPVAGQFGACAAGLAYLLWIETVEGGGGQAPIFYNLFVAAAAICTFKAIGTPQHERGQFHRFAFAAMALGGIAIQIKYTVIFEVAYFGALLAWREIRAGAILPGGFLRVLALVLVAFCPTISALAFYAVIGHLSAFWFANFVSVFLRSATDPGELHLALIEMVKHVSPLFVCFIASLWQIRVGGDEGMRRRQMFVCGWLAAAFAGYFSVGALFYHYMLPLFVPLAIAGSPIFRRWPLGFVMAGLVLWIPFVNLDYPDFAYARRISDKTEAIEHLIPRDVDRKCMQMFAGPPILYLRTHACFATPYIFPDHLVARIETHAVGLDTKTELRRLMARHPRVILTNDSDPRLDPASLAVLRAVRDLYYRRVGRVEFEGRPIDVWVSVSKAHATASTHRIESSS
jgi:hypothetical protein